MLERKKNNPAGSAANPVNPAAANAAGGAQISNAAANLAQNAAQDAANLARILYYDFFAGLFLHDLLQTRAALLLRQIALLKIEPIAREDLAHFGALEREITQNGTKNLLSDFVRIFMLPFEAARDSGASARDSGAANPAAANPPNAQAAANLAPDSRPKNKKKKRTNPQVMLYLSCYLDGTIAGAGLVLARAKVKKSPVRLNEAAFRENEEHLGFLFIFMKYLLQNGESALSREVFRDCIRPMIFKVADSLIEREGSREDSGEDSQGDSPLDSRLDSRPDSPYFAVGCILKSFAEAEDSLLDSP